MTQYAAAQYADVPTICDLRSDTVTQPNSAMRAAMAEAEVGDDVYGEDTTVDRLEADLAERAGKEAGLFCPSGTQSNLLALLSHCGRGEEIITGRDYHVYKYEAGGASVLGGIMFDALPVDTDGCLDPTAVVNAVKEDDSHHAVSRLLSLENTHNGKVIGLSKLSEVVTAGRDAGLSAHLDGARVFNACAALNCEIAQVAELFDSVSICLSKGLGAPVGSVLVGPAELVSRARRWRKMVGGGMRQAGILAAAGLYALEHNVARLSEDHEKARELAQLLEVLEAGTVVQNTNMVFLSLGRATNTAFSAFLAKRGVVISAGEQGPIRLVLHKDVTEEGFQHVMKALRSFFQ